MVRRKYIVYSRLYTILQRIQCIVYSFYFLLYRSQAVTVRLIVECCPEPVFGPSWGVSGLRPQNGQNPIFAVLGFSRAFLEPSRSVSRFLRCKSRGMCRQRVQNAGAGQVFRSFLLKCSPLLWRIRSSLRRGGQMFTPFMKNTLFSEKRRCSRISLQRHMFTPFVKNALFFEKRRSSRMSLHRQMFTPFMKNTLFFEKRWRSRMSLQRQMFTPVMKNTLFFARRRSNVHPFYE